MIGELPMTKYRVLKATNGQYFVRVIASNGQTLAHSETYTRHYDAKHCATLMADGGTVEDWAA